MTLETQSLQACQSSAYAEKKNPMQQLDLTGNIYDPPIYQLRAVSFLLTVTSLILFFCRLQRNLFYCITKFERYKHEHFPGLDIDRVTRDKVKLIERFSHNNNDT